MRLISLDYIEFAGSPREWSLSNLKLGEKNLIVGKNASGKSRTINVIHSLSRCLSGAITALESGKFIANFEQENSSYSYTLEFKDNQVIFEQLLINNIEYLLRDEDGLGKIFAEKIGNGENIEFRSPAQTIAAFSKRDELQHSYLEPLFSWASSLRYYPFSSYLGKDIVNVLIPNGPKPDERDFNAAFSLFREGVKNFKDDFINSIKNDLATIDYPVDEINVSAPITFKFQEMFGQPSGLHVKEKDLPGITDQYSMSTGMFRALALIIHANYIEFKKSASTILIDDIGEGLDFDRSCKLIELLRIKADKSDLQLIMSTNDRFVMNSVPLEEWSIVNRIGNHVEIKNYQNSRDIFEDFKFTGLSNFSFFELDVINENQK